MNGTQVEKHSTKGRFLSPKLNFRSILLESETKISRRKRRGNKMTTPKTSVREGCQPLIVAIHPRMLLKNTGCKVDK